MLLQEGLVLPHPEERMQCASRRMGGLSFETHRWRDAPQDEAGRDCAGRVARMQRSGMWGRRPTGIIDFVALIIGI